MPEALVALLGHELRAPVSGLQSSAELLVHYLDDELDSDMARLVARRVLRLSTHLGVMIQDLFEMARISSGSGEPARVRFDPMKAVTWAVEVVESTNGMPPIVVTAPTSQLQVLGDARRLSRAVMNLLTNAAKHAPLTDHIDVRISVDNDAVLIDVEDYGPGIPAGDQARIFEPYGRAVRENVGGLDDTSRADGLGLGLYIVDRIVTSHGGSVGVVSALGKGSRFTISLPRTRPNDSSDSPDAPSSRPESPIQRPVPSGDDRL